MMETGLDVVKESHRAASMCSIICKHTLMITLVIQHELQLLKKKIKNKTKTNAIENILYHNGIILGG